MCNYSSPVKYIIHCANKPRKRARYDSGEDLIDPSEMFGGGAGGFSSGGIHIDPSMLFNMMGGGGGGFSFANGGGHPFGAAGMGGGRQRGAQYQQGFPFSM